LHEIFGGVAAYLSCSCGWCCYVQRTLDSYKYFQVI